MTIDPYSANSRSGTMQQYAHIQDDRPRQLQLGVRNSTDQQHNQPRDSLFLPQPQNAGGHNGASYVSSRDHSREQTMTGDYSFRPTMQNGYGDVGAYGAPHDISRQSTLLDSHQGYFSDFAGQQSNDPAGMRSDRYGGGPHRYSSGDAFSPTAAMAPPMMQMGEGFPVTLASLPPLEPRDVPFAVYDPHDGNVPMSKFDNIASVLRHRGRTNAKQPAYWVLDSKGKEIASITWEKLLSRAEKVAQVIRDKSNLYRGDRVALIYRDTEVIEFAVALLGCFIAGVVAVPINQTDDHAKLNLVLTSTQAHLALTTDNNLKAFQRDITTQKLNWPRGVEWWKTNEFGSFHPKKKDEVSPLVVPDLAYIEFTRAPTGDLRGVVMSHRTIMHQMACLSAIISCVPSPDSTGNGVSSGNRDKNGKLLSPAGYGDILLTYLDARQGIGLILGILLTVYGGHTAVWMEAKAVETSGLYANIITRYKTTLMVADYPGLKRAAFNYQTDPMTTRNFQKKFEPNFSTVKLCLIDTLTVDTEFHEILADRWFKPMRNSRARDVVAPMLCLPEYGGMVISMRDWLGGEEHMGTILRLYDENGEASAMIGNHGQDGAGPTNANGYASLIGGGTKASPMKKGRTELMEVLLDKEALKTNEIIVLGVGEEARKRANEPGVIRVGAFGYPIPDATLAVVDPETCSLCPPYIIGEVWVDSPSLSGGFWALPKHTENIFHARPYRFEANNPTPTLVEPEFLRTGLLGTVIEGKIFVLGLYEDRLRQKVEWVEHGMETTEYRYFFVQHLIVTLMKNVSKIYDW
jgi:acyl-CoA synthetase (AMP-forming)/AMP-acid ligase II